ncbi:hypothetical protein [Streptomyces geranii]|uniref:hypothetical protein n=1 Tax=Streptomyces geranii TaxID=2058923 RepID=UPI001E34EEFA|nr:hypothetical protein [Streptomyces geranii]
MAIRARVGPHVDTALAAVDVAAIVFTVRRSFARRHVLAEARRHLLETLRGRAFEPGLDDSIADLALTRHSRQLTVPQKGRRAPSPDQLSYTADFAWPHRWWIAGTDGEPPRESSRYERARVASLAPTQWAAAVQAHQQAAMPELLEGRTTDPATWMHTPKNLARLAALKLETDARGRAVAAHQLKHSEQPATDAAGPVDQQQHQNRNSQGRGGGLER